MPMTDEDIEEMKSLIAVARKRPLQFGICLGKKPETTVFIMHRLKDGEILGRRAKKEGETAKIAYGEVNAKGKKLMLSCVGDPPPGIAKRLRLFLKGHDLPMKVLVLDPLGGLLEDDGEPEEEDGGEVEAEADETEADEAGAAPEPAADPLEANWEKVRPAITALVERAEKAGADKAPQIRAAWTAAGDAADRGNYKDALAVAAKLRSVLAGGAADEQASPDAKRWAALEPALAALYDRAMAANPENRSQLTAAWGMATERAGAGDHAGALQVAGRLKPALDAAIAKGGNGATAEVPKDVVPFQKSRVIWRSTRSTMQAELAKLEAAIVAACAGDPELAPIAAEASEMTRRLAVFDERLEDILDAITNTPEGDRRTALKAEARTALKEYQGALETDFFKDVDNDNGFVSVAVAASARKSLDAIAKVLG